MKIFYGVQGTGNGHITRARIMAAQLQNANMEVTYQFSGRPAADYFDMEVFNGYQIREGLTFNTHKGQVNYLKTVLESKPITFIRDVNDLDLSDYDLVISDFEPVTAWAAKSQKKPVLGIGHQYAFAYDIPKSGTDPLASGVMKLFAPANIGIGLHWHHFNQPILPPIIETLERPSNTIRNKIIVYLPFEDQNEVLQLLEPFQDYEFHVYAPRPVVSSHAHIHCHPLSRAGFQKNLYDSAGIISNAGFELASESLQLGKKILAKPLHAQMEQISNAAALKQLGYGHVMNTLDAETVDEFLNQPQAVWINYPNTAKYITEWIAEGMKPMDTSFIDSVWQGVEAVRVTL
jgi:uncharacterized protein (TIGR00661 family)